MATSVNISEKKLVKLVVRDSKYIATLETQKLLDEVGGVRALQLMTSIFYQTMFKNPHMEKFFMKTEINLHADRLAFWVAEKMGGVAESEGVDYCKTDCNQSGAVEASEGMFTL